MTQSRLPEKELVKKCATGSRKAWNTFVESYSRLVYHVVHKTLKNRNLAYAKEDVEDIFENVFHCLVEDDYRLLKSFGEPYNLTAWLAVITRRHTNRYMTKKRRGDISLEAAGDDSSIQEEMADPTDDPQAKSSQKEMEDIVIQMIKKMPKRDQTIIKLFYYEELPHKEIAERMGISINTVGKALFRARQKLKKSVEKKYGQY